MLNAKEIEKEGLIVLRNAKGKFAQVGYDLSIRSISSLDGGGRVMKSGTEVNTLTPVRAKEYMYGGVKQYGWDLAPGTYDVTCNEGCDIAANRTAMVRQRSSLLRNGAIIASSIFDPGFKTNNIGTVMIVTKHIFIEHEARIAQMYFHENNEGELYDGQFQNDKQRG
jgi:deoxycytidine triphosphate deaminase